MATLEAQASAPLHLGSETLAPVHDGLSLFWRTYVLLVLLLLGSALAWIQTLHTIEFEPRVIQTAQQVASLVNLSREAVKHSDVTEREALYKAMMAQERLLIAPHDPRDTFEPVENDELSQRVANEIMKKLGSGTLVAASVNKVNGLWVGFTIDRDKFWLKTNRPSLNEPASKTWLIWLAAAIAMSLAGAAWVARLINRPLKALSFAADRVRQGDFEASRLNETVSTTEIRNVNIDFNRMTRKLAKIDEDRAVMLAGISHDLRTPLARLRLETELSVADPDARENMANDIDHLDGIIDKFLDYARPGHSGLKVVSLNQTVESCVQSLRKRTDMQFKVALQDKLKVKADPVELHRIITNLLENAGRYGKSPDTGIAVVEISARVQEKAVLIRVRDYGVGVPPDQLKKLTTPFFRGESARTAANGTGLGLAIVEKTISRMGGLFELSNASSGGLCAHIKLQRGFIEVTA